MFPYSKPPPEGLSLTPLSKDWASLKIFQVRNFATGILELSPYNKYPTQRTELQNSFFNSGSVLICTPHHRDLFVASVSYSHSFCKEVYLNKDRNHLKNAFTEKSSVLKVSILFQSQFKFLKDICTKFKIKNLSKFHLWVLILIQIRTEPASKKAVQKAQSFGGVTVLVNSLFVGIHFLF